MLSEDIKRLEENYDKAIERIQYLESEINKLERWKQEALNVISMVIPVKIYTHKERKNTTVKFRDGSQQTVKRKSNEKDCVETALAYCLLHQILSTKDLKKLIKEREEH